MQVDMATVPVIYWYLCTPYSMYPRGRHAAFGLACRQAGLLLTNGYCVYSPIAHTHPVAEFSGLDPDDLELWLPADYPMMRAACGAIMLRAEGWQASVGMRKEREYFLATGKPVVYMDVGVIPPQLIFIEQKRYREMNLCKDCRYVYSVSGEAVCSHPSTCSPVTGKPMEPLCETMRGVVGTCGPEGRLFTSKPPTMPPAPNATTE